MKRIVLAVAVVLLGVAALAPAAQARVAVGIGIGGGYYPGYYPYYGYPYYGYPAYVAPPPVVYEEAPPTVTYAQPAYPAQPVYAPPPQPMPPPEGVAPATQTSNTYTDHAGRLCRRFQTAMEDGSPVTGAACQQPDGSWKTVQ